MGTILTKEAIISPCKKYRYFLNREIKSEGKTLTFIMLNPSTADASDDDPTIRRCIGFCNSLGYSKLNVVNLFAFRSTNPKELLKVNDPVGPENLSYIEKTIHSSDMVICAWGAKYSSIKNQDKHILSLLKHYDLYALKVTKNGCPHHPLRLSSDLRPILFRKKI
ncbi:MAG TPA: DUF1643 domain-containing protein [Alphaproteobacteria bacterium]|nr:DUF1643 domain-containing protein [Alphaproteobacteria bacterium]HNS44823.1 DUF1643 domain-containing protein [Alphaproteobacteria bacterium]